MRNGRDKKARKELTVKLEFIDFKNEKEEQINFRLM